MVSVYDIAKYFIKKGYDTPRNTLNGNMKLQKLIVFSYIYYLVFFNKKLFEDSNIYAFKNGCVCECIRKNYRINCKSFVEESMEFEPKLDDNILSTLIFVENNLADKTANELSKMNHQFEFWSTNYENSKGFFGIPFKENSIVNDEKIINEKEKIIKWFNSFSVEELIVVNGIKFYYNKNDIVINEEIRKLLSNFVPVDDEDTYTIYNDESVGIVIY